jgi:transcriptional regulator with GAF, ATPase, and Fis domain
MVRNTTWLRFCGCGGAFQIEMRQKLEAACIPIATDMASPYGIVCFQKLDGHLLELLQETQYDPSVRILAIAAPPHATDQREVWRLLHAGASDVLCWKESDDGVKQLRAKLARWIEVDDLTARMIAQESLIGRSPNWHCLVRKVVEAARFSTIPVLLAGESGTGKELLAKLISAASAACEQQKFRKELVVVDCGSLVPELSGSEFFGHERGAFTGAHTQRDGAFALANGATLLLDEIGEVPLGLQAQLLRAIQEKTYKRVGGNVWQQTSFRLVAATNRDLEDLVQRGQFRLDLYHRIAGFVFKPPPLRERKEDIVQLAKYFLAESLSGCAPVLDAAVSEYLLNREYKGNIRELRQLMERIAHRHTGPGPVTPGDIPEEDRPRDGEIDQSWPDREFERSISRAVATGTGLKKITQMAAETAIRIAVRSEGNNLQMAARRLGVTDRTLQLRRATGRM